MTEHVLREYSASMKRLIETRKYDGGKRPSSATSGSSRPTTKGAVPPNVIDGDDAPGLGTLLKGTNAH